MMNKVIWKDPFSAIYQGKNILTKEKTFVKVANIEDLKKKYGADYKAFV